MSERDDLDPQQRIWNRMKEITDTARAENRDLTADEETNWEVANADLDKVLRKIERDRRMTELDSVDLRQVIHPSDAGIDPESAEERAEREASRYELAFRSWVKGGFDSLAVEERQLVTRNFTTDKEVRAAAGTTSGAAGGYLIPPGYRMVLVETMKAYGGLLNLANVITTETGNSLQWPTNNDVNNVGYVLAEGTQVSQDSFTFGTRTIGAWMYTSGLELASLQILQDAAFNLDQWLPEHLGIRLGRGIAADLVNGAGTAGPTGVTVGITSTVTGSDPLGTLTYDNLIDLEHSLDPAYRQGNVRFLMNDNTLSVIRKIVDGFGRPLWVPIPVPGMSPTINGQAYAIDQAMPLMTTASATPIIFGDFNKGYIVRQVLDMQMIRFAERYMDFLQVGYMAFTRLDARPDDPSALVAFQNKSS